MTAGGRIEVDGLSELRRALRKAGEDAADLKDANEEAGRTVADAAAPLARRLTGAMAGSIRPARQVGGAIVRAGRGSMVYVPVQHFGWPGHNITPNPFLFDALDQRRQAVIDAYDKAIGKIADRI